VIIDFGFLKIRLNLRVRRWDILSSFLTGRHFVLAPFEANTQLEIRAFLRDLFSPLAK